MVHDRSPVRDVDTFTDFVRTSSAGLMRRAYLLTGDVQLAEDLLQSALAKTAARWRHVGENPEGYVRRILYADSVSWWRRRRIKETLPGTLPEAPIGGFDEHVVRRLALQRALWRLTPKQRAVLVLRFYDDLSEADTAEALGCTVGTVKSQTAHSLARLRVLAPELLDLLTDPIDTEVIA